VPASIVRCARTASHEHFFFIPLTARDLTLKAFHLHE
jgi:hypothetical protein